MVSTEEGAHAERGRLTEKAVLLIRRRRPIGESPDLEPGAIPGAARLHGSAGAGRVLHSLSELEFRFRTVIQAVVDGDLTATDIDALDAGGQFVAVILGSHLVNTPDEEPRRAWLRAACRHLVGDGDALVEHHPIDWAETAEPTLPTPGAEVGMRDVRRDPPFVSAVSVYDVGGRVARQPFRARVLSDAELEADLHAAGLFVRRRLSPTWLQAGPIEPRTWSVPQREHRRNEDPGHEDVRTSPDALARSRRCVADSRLSRVTSSRPRQVLRSRRLRRLPGLKCGPDQGNLQR